VEHTAEQTITILRGGAGYVRVILRGHSDHHVAQRLRTQLGAVLDAGARYLTVDLSGLTCCDEIVLDVLDWAARRASSQQGWLALTGGHRHFRFTAR
jgi:anti-anti-sigma regulatory factor